MEIYLEYLAIRFAVIGGVIALAVLALFAVAMILRRLGKLDRARDMVEPMIRESARRRGGLANMVVERVVKERR
ncbi:hypothetical protein [Kutzneria sp. 744]|uniref:hypothetical protein n=1 Tax=Kutzneria sp. (strain 744) TaxID=345341 RepID=UPI0003EED0DD|nr:hypothetical protein [Kutzneria sp. 744]EWM13496.1 hypothetical protein KUTG_03800 [Kutzneria sp. 744]